MWHSQQSLLNINCLAQEGLSYGSKGKCPTCHTSLYGFIWLAQKLFSIGPTNIRAYQPQSSVFISFPLNLKFHLQVPLAGVHRLHHHCHLRHPLHVPPHQALLSLVLYSSLNKFYRLRIICMIMLPNQRELEFIQSM